jgi:diketogulonate reductase-like aldo/keto reductase
MDKYYDLYIEMFGLKHIGCYTHDIGEGHFTELLIEYRDLKGFEQQSWEKLNHVAVQIFNHQTHRGGAKNESAAQVLMRSFRRKNVIWLCKQIGPNDLKERIDMLEKES